jgi:hypothetical protein
MERGMRNFMPNLGKKGSSRVKTALLAVLSLALLLVLGGVEEGVASTYSCRKVVSDCESSHNIKYGSCLGYFAGMSGWEFFLQVNLKQHKLFCFPETITTGRLKRVFLKYLQDHPEELDRGASLCFFNAMSEAFPCK